MTHLSPVSFKACALSSFLRSCWDAHLANASNGIEIRHRPSPGRLLSFRTMRRLHLTTGGESHGPGLTAILTGLPAGLRVDFGVLARDLARRQHGYGRGNRMKIETDTAEVRGGVRGGETLGSPLVLWIANRDYENWVPMMSPV